MQNMERHIGNCTLAGTVAAISLYIKYSIPVEEMQELKNMLLRIKVPEIAEDSDMYEAKLRSDYLNLLEELDAKIAYN